MVARRVPLSWLAPDQHEAMGIVLQHIGVTWPEEERERILDIVREASFTPALKRDLWGGRDISEATVEGVPYYPITVSLADKPNLWFKNLRLIQIRRVLGLITHVLLRMPMNPCPSGEIVVKMVGLEQAVGKEVMGLPHMPPLKRMRAMTTCVSARVANAWAEASRGRGLAARERREAQE